MSKWSTPQRGCPWTSGEDLPGNQEKLNNVKNNTLEVIEKENFTLLWPVKHIQTPEYIHFGLIGGEQTKKRKA